MHAERDTAQAGIKLSRQIKFQGRLRTNSPNTEIANVSIPSSTMPPANPASGPHVALSPVLSNSVNVGIIMSTPVAIKPNVIQARRGEYVSLVSV